MRPRRQPSLTTSVDFRPYGSSATIRSVCAALGAQLGGRDAEPERQRARLQLERLQRLRGLALQPPADPRALLREQELLAVRGGEGDVEVRLRVERDPAEDDRAPVGALLDADVVDERDARLQRGRVARVAPLARGEERDPPGRAREQVQRPGRVAVGAGLLRRRQRRRRKLGERLPHALEREDAGHRVGRGSRDTGRRSARGAAPRRRS